MSDPRALSHFAPARTLSRPTLNRKVSFAMSENPEVARLRAAVGRAGRRAAKDPALAAEFQAAREAYALAKGRDVLEHLSGLHLSRSGRLELAAQLVTSGSA